MTNSLKIKAAFSEAQTLIYSQIKSSYVAFGQKLLHPAQMLIITKDLNQPVFLSTDGVTDMLYLPYSVSDFQVIDFSANKQGTGKLALPAGTVFYVRNASTTTLSAGLISVTTIYGA